MAARVIFLIALIAAAAAAFNATRPYNCTTDTECEAEAAARCLFFCER